MGTWIEMDVCTRAAAYSAGRALMGTWIEIAVDGAAGKSVRVVPSWARGLKSPTSCRSLSCRVVPSWARGLKYLIHDKCCYTVAVVPAKAV